MSAGGTARTPDPRLAELARTSRDFNFLYDHLVRLVAYGAAAESHVFTDPNTSLLKSRQFGEALAAGSLGSFLTMSSMRMSSLHSFSSAFRMC
ncbi:hypothetical protein ACVV2G_21525 [Streptomyces ziwulingensis]